MQRRTLLKRSVALVATGVSLAGCSSDNDSGGDGGGGTTGGGGETTGDGGATATATRTETATPTETTTQSQVEGSVTSEVDGLTVPEYTVEGDDFPNRFGVTPTVKNAGQKETAALDYNFDMTVYDADGNDITDGNAAAGGGDTTIGPGETTQLDITVAVTGSLSDVARFEAVIKCTGPVSSDGVYCQ